MATLATGEDTRQQVLKAKDNVEATPTLHKGKDASLKLGIEALEVRGQSAMAIPPQRRTGGF